MPADCPIVVLSDVDGVVAASAAPAFAAAARVLKHLAREDVALVFCSSRTRAELEHIRQELGGDHPFIAERGSAVFIPNESFGFDVPDARDIAGYRAVEFGRPYGDIVQTLRSTARRLRIKVRGFDDMSVEEVAREGQLSLLQARLAKLREYGELFRVVDGSSATRNRLFKGLHGAHLRCVGAGRYDHVGAAVDMNLGVNMLCTLYRRAYGPLLTVGLADAMSEVAFLQLVDYPVFVQSRETNTTPPILKRMPRVRVTPAVDVGEWADAILDIVQGLRRHGGDDGVRPSPASVRAAAWTRRDAV